MGVRLSNNRDEIKAIDDYLLDQKKKNEKNANLAMRAINKASPSKKNGVSLSEPFSNGPVSEAEQLMLPLKPFCENGLSGDLSEAVTSDECRDDSGKSASFSPDSEPMLAARGRLKGLSTMLDSNTGHVLYLDGRRCVMSEDLENKKLFVSDKPSDEDILIMLVAAKEKYGEKFKLFGTDDFIKRCTAIALVHNINMQEFSANEKQRMRQ